MKHGLIIALTLICTSCASTRVKLQKAEANRKIANTPQMGQLGAINLSGLGH
jgi:hypothetical protein